MRIPMKMSVQIIMTRTSIPHSELRKTNSLLIYCADATFQVRNILFQNFTKPVLPFYFTRRIRHILMNSDDKSYSVCRRKLYQVFFPQPPAHSPQKRFTQRGLCTRRVLHDQKLKT